MAWRMANRGMSTPEKTTLINTVDLGGLTTTTDTDADINVSEALLAKDQDGLENLQAKDLGLDQLKGDTVNTDHSLSGLAVGDGSGRFLQRNVRSESWKGTSIPFFRSTGRLAF